MMPVDPVEKLPQKHVEIFYKMITDEQLGNICYWKEISTNPAFEKKYETACGHELQLDEYDIKEINFCPYCGKTIAWEDLEE